MRKLVAIAALALLAPATASAKELVKLQVCGPSACAAITDKAQLLRMGEGGVRANTPALGPYFKLIYTIDIPADEPNAPTFEAWYVPSSGVQGSGRNERGFATWWKPNTEFREAVAAAAAGIEPFAKPQITEVRIGGKLVARPATYERLLTLNARRGWRAVRDWKKVWFVTDRQSPWSDGAALRYSPKRGYINRDGKTMVLPKAVASRMRSAAALSGGAIACGVVFAGLLAFRVRRRG
jgi:hypothetical protein